MKERSHDPMEVDSADWCRCMATTLPVELLTMVFSRETEPARLMELASVCRRWKDIILSEPTLWKFVRVWVGSTDRQLALSLERASGCDLSVKLILHPPMDDPQLLGRITTLVKQRHRIADMHVHLNWTEETDDPDAELVWPAALVDSLGGSLDWPKLRRLYINGSPEPANTLFLDMVCPRLAELELTCVDARQHDWARVVAGPSLRKMILDECFVGPQFFSALNHCPNLQELSLNSQAAAVFPQQRLHTNLTLSALTRLTWNWTNVDLELFLAVLSACPNVDCAIVKVDRFEPLDGSGSHARGPAFALPSLREFNLCIDDPGGCGDIMRHLSLKDRAPKLRCLTLSGVTLFPALSIPPQLGRINLARLSVTPSQLRQQLCRCTQLDAVVFQQLLVEAEESDNLVEPRLPHLLSASLKAMRDVDRLVAAADVASANQRMLDFMLSLLPKGPTRPFISVSVSGIRLNADDVGEILPSNDTDYPLSLMLMEPGDGLGTEMKLITHAVVTSNGRRRSATVHSLRLNSAHESLRTLNTGIRLFSRLILVSVQAPVLTTLFGLLPDELPALQYFQITFSDEAQASTFPATCASILQTISCPALETVNFNGIWRKGTLVLRITPAVRELFLTRVRSEHKVKLEAGGVAELVFADEE
ncbi:hypothetical protein AURDEDRAFT_182030 [Auricularia subglabra TFB-10046 SS5]|nr:hypothetical protein AURDEDRAFT_182030 [Auricularia subglabra TFB-10046 SS5]